MSLAVLCAVLAAAPSPPPELRDVARTVSEHFKAGAAEAKVGSWVTYEASGGGDRVHYWRLAIVGEETDPRGRPAYWLEMEIGEHHALRAPLSQLKLLVARGAGIDRDGVTRVILSWGVAKPTELAPDALAAFLRDEPEAPGTPEVTAPPGVALQARTGPQTRLLTAGGTVDAVPISIMLRDTVVKRMWISRQVPILHLARVEVPAISHTLEARDWGIDAKPRIPVPAGGAPKIRVERYDEGQREAPASAGQEASSAPPSKQ